MPENANPPIMLKEIEITICVPCLNGLGDECHTPGCALFLHTVDLPIPPEVYTVINTYFYDEDSGEMVDEVTWKKNLEDANVEQR